MFFLLWAIACGGLEEPLPEDCTMPAPWHLWGNSQTIQLIGNAGTQTDSKQQLVKVSYGRPETFEFLFFARVLSIAPNVAATGINVYFDVTVGLGRASTTIEGFERFQFSWLAGAGLVNQLYRTDSVIVPYRSQYSSAVDPYPDVPNTIDHLVAQDINCQVRTTMAPAAGEVIDLEVAAYFCPRSHVRPEWIKGEFPGGEDRGL